MKRTIFSLSFMALFLMLFVVSCQKTGDQPNPKTETAKSPRGDKSGQFTLQEQLVANNDFRQIYEGHREFDSLMFAKINSLDAPQRIAFANLLSSFNGNTPVETIVNAFDITTAKYEAMMRKINNGHINLRNSFSAVGSLTSEAYADLLGGGYSELDDVYPRYGSPAIGCDELKGYCMDSAKNKYDKEVDSALSNFGTGTGTVIKLAGDVYALSAAGCQQDWNKCIEQ